MTESSRSFGLSAQEKASLLKRLISRRKSRDPEVPELGGTSRSSRDDLSDLEFHKQIQVVRSASRLLGIDNPYFGVHDGIAGAETVIGGRRYVNFSSYNYLGFNGHPAVAGAAKEAIERYGTSVSASRMVSGERTVHRDLERCVADLYAAEDCLTFVSGHATNVTVIGHLLGANDLILHDAFIHNSVLQGAQLSGARRLGFAHCDPAAADRLLSEQRPRHGRCLIVIEGHYSMDGDVPDLPAFLDLARRHDAWLMVDEAHSVGVLGARGHGIAEHFGIDPGRVDLWMGTLSKTLSACGGYVAGRRDLIDYLKYSVPGFVYSVGMSPPVAAAALASIDLLHQEPQRVARLNANARLFLDRARAAGLDTGFSAGHAIVPIITGSSIAAARLAEALFKHGVNVQPILYPAVPERSARLRFFLSSEHTAEHIDRAIAALTKETRRIAARKEDVASLASRLKTLVGQQ